VGFLDKVKASAEQAATMAREGVQEMQTKRELSDELKELGQKAFDLAERGELSHAELSPGIERVRALNKELEEAGQEKEAATASASTSASSAPDSEVG
jgi:hypothetical protein